MSAKLPLSIYTNYYADLPAESQLVKIREAGFTHCELRAPIPFDDERGLARQAAVHTGGRWWAGPSGSPRGLP